MTSVRIVLPVEEDIPAQTLMTRLRAVPVQRPFCSMVMRLGSKLSSRLLSDPAARAVPALQALGFWARPAALARLKAAWEARIPAGAVSVPRGTVLHIPPGNVDTIFVYSWLLSLLCGNRNVVRLPSAESPTLIILCRLLAEVLAEQPEDLRRGSAILRYGHDDAVTGTLSAEADLRVIWGGDATVQHIRTLPLAPQAADLVFPDRHSLAAFNATAVDALDEVTLIALAEHFFNDAFWFDQMGCSSPRLVAWCGEAAESQAASSRFFSALAHVVQAKRYSLDVSTALAKLTFAHQAVLTASVSQVRRLGNEVMVLSLDKPVAGEPPGFGAGTFFELRLNRLEELVPCLTRRHQTLTTFGFRAEALRTLAEVANGRGVDRIVPVGEALAFEHVWDGEDLLSAFTRLVVVRA